MTTTRRENGQTETAFSSSNVLHFDMCTKLRKAFAEFSAETLAQAEATAKAKREDELVRGYAKRREPDTAA